MKRSPADFFRPTNNSNSQLLQKTIAFTHSSVAGLEKRPTSRPQELAFHYRFATSTCRWCPGMKMRCSRPVPIPVKLRDGPYAKCQRMRATLPPCASKVMDGGYSLSTFTCAENCAYSKFCRNRARQRAQEFATNDSRIEPRDRIFKVFPLSLSIYSTIGKIASVWHLRAIRSASF